MSKATITVLRERAELERLWREQDPLAGASVTFKDAPGDRGTEIHVELGSAGNPLTSLLRRGPLAKVKDELRRFKQRVETGEVSRSDGTPEGELAERKFKQRPAQPLEASELEEVGVR
jgi:hypothetical protein